MIDLRRACERARARLSLESLSATLTRPAALPQLLRAVLVIQEDLARLVPELAIDPATARAVARAGLDRYAIDSAVLHATLFTVRARGEGRAFALGAAHALGELLTNGAPSRASTEPPIIDDEAREGALRGVEAAHEAVAGLVRAVNSAAPRSLASVLNPDAGLHAITTDLREVRAALEASDISWQRFGYYEARFGERGRRFARSDSAWLAVLDPEDLERQLGWLGTVLASRGAPRWLLEDHLGVLHERLCAAIPARRSRYRVLSNGARWLAEQRRTVVGDELLARCERELPELRAGALFAAAHADERCGVERAVESMEPWLREHFGVSAIARVRACLEGAADSPRARASRVRRSR